MSAETPPRKKRGRPPGQQNTERFPPLRLTLDMDDPVEAAIVRVLKDALAQGERGLFTKTAIALLKRGITAPEPDAPPEE